MKPVFQTNTQGHYFFGYFDKSPLSADSTKLLSHSTLFLDRVAGVDDKVDLGYFNWQDENRFIKVSESFAWNWQQGSMLQWLGPDFESRLVFNDRADGRAHSVILELENQSRVCLDRAICSVSRGGDFSICVDFEKLHWFRNGYSYAGIENIHKKAALESGSGIWLQNHATNTSELIVGLTDLVKIEPMPMMKRGSHYIDHAILSPNGTRVCFLHRWHMDDGGFYTRVFVVDTSGENLQLLLDTGKASHFCWRSDDELLVYCALSTTANNLRKNELLNRYVFRYLLPIYHRLVPPRSRLASEVTGQCYVLFDLKEGEQEALAKFQLPEDGHPSFHPNNADLLLTDTYPSDQSKVPLILYDLELKKKTVIDELKSINQYDDTAMRCDLHPRWSGDGQYIIIDTMDLGVRGMYIYDTSSI